VTTAPPEITVCLTEADRWAALAADARAGLTAERKMLPSKWLYDERGSDLFEQITRLPEYYPTRAERAILDRHAHEVAVLSGAGTLIELGSGTSTKTRLLLDALARAGTLRRFVALDVAEATVVEALTTLAGDYPGVAMAGVVGDLEVHLDRLPEGHDRLVAFLGGTVGNFEPAARKAFFAAIADLLHDDETLLLGTDLVKDRARILRAYDDAAGVTAAFEKNALAVVNHGLDADFDLDHFTYRAAWSEIDERVEMGVVARARQLVRLGDLDLEVEVAPGEEIRTEVSAKFRLEGIGEELRSAGLEPISTWTDAAEDFGLTLARRTA
jgi:L-histidine N-alpha-methyltransferase